MSRSTRNDEGPSDAVLRWSSEPFGIPYVNPTKRGPQLSLYRPDFIGTYISPSGESRTDIIEVKPLIEATGTGTVTDAQRIRYVVNQAKFEAAKAFAERRGMSFRILTG